MLRCFLFVMTLTRGFSNKKARMADETLPREERKDKKKLAFILEALAAEDPFQNNVCVCVFVVQCLICYVHIWCLLGNSAG